MFYYVYILQSKRDKRFYAGFTNDLRKRLEQHNQGKNISTKNRRPLELVYYEAYKNREDAERRELQLKSGPGKAYLKRRIKRFLELSG